MDKIKEFFKEHGRLVVAAAAIFIAGAAFAVIANGCSGAV